MSCTESSCYKACKAKVNAINIGSVANVLSYIGMQELCWNNLGNNDGAKELSIIPEF